MKHVQFDDGTTLGIEVSRKAIKIYSIYLVSIANQATEYVVAQIEIKLMNNIDREPDM